MAFYRSVFRWGTDTLHGEHEIAYSTLRDRSGAGPRAGIMDASRFMRADEAPHWSVYWEVDDVDATVGQVRSLGGSVVLDAMDTPFGRLATVTDPAGAEFKLRTS